MRNGSASREICWDRSTFTFRDCEFGSDCEDLGFHPLDSGTWHLCASLLGIAGWLLLGKRRIYWRSIRTSQIVQKCPKKSVDVLHGHGLSGLWFGANPNKGLAVFCSAQFKVKAVDKLFGKWVVPVRVHGAVVDFNLLAIWACPVRTRRADNYIGEVHRCLVKHRGWFSNAPAVAAGDFNSNVQWDANRPGRNHTEAVRLFEGHGLISAYHVHHGEKQGTETRPTYYSYRHIIGTSPFTSTTYLCRQVGG
jgi:hypothetical protein